MLSKRQLFLQHVAQTSDFPMYLEVSHASGMYIYDTDGKKYLDFDSGISVSSLGHCHPKVVEAVKMQTETYMHTMVYGEHIQSPQVEYATLLSQTLNNDLDSIYYVNSGTEAVEVSIKLARKATGRYEIISCAQAYHGSTLAAESLRSDTAYTRHFVPAIPGVRHIKFNDEASLEMISERTACVILEPVQAEAGIIPPEEDFLKKVRKKCDETGTLMILDEIQTGFGRTGFMFAYQKYGIKPDILLIAKGMGGGMPIGGMVAPKSLMMHLSRNPALGHITTFGGHPVCVAAALATLQVLLEENYIDEIERKENLFRSLLKHPLISRVRSSGLMIGVQLKEATLLTPLIEQVIKDGVLIDYFLFNPASFRIAPPLIITDEEIKYGVNIIISTLDYISK